MPGCSRPITWRCPSARRSAWAWARQSPGLPTWHTAFLIAGAPGLLLALLALVLPDPVRGTSEGVDEPRLRLHERVGPSREDYIDLMVNSSYTYSVFGLAFSMFAIGGLVFWLPTFLLVVHEMPAARVSSWLSLTVPAAMVLGIAIGGWLADRYSRSIRGPCSSCRRLAMLGSIPFLLMAIFGRDEGMIYLGVFVAIALMFTNAGPCYAIIANVVMPNMRAVACAVAMAATHLLGDIWSPTLMAWVADTFGQADSMATPVRPGPGGDRRRAQGPARPRPREPDRGPPHGRAGAGDRGHRAALRRPPPAPRDGPDARQAPRIAEPRGDGRSQAPRALARGDAQPPRARKRSGLTADGV